MALGSPNRRLDTMEEDRKAGEERPKKMPKRDPSPDATPEAENPLPQPIPAAIDSSDLKPLEQPEITITTLLEELESKNWSRQCDALNGLRKLALHHAALLLPLLGKILPVLVKSMKNPRSAVCRISIRAASDVFGSFGDVFPPASEEEAAGFDQLLLQLMLKASQDKKFICEEATEALNKMASCVRPLALLAKLQSYVRNKNHRVRARAAVTISTCVSKTGHATLQKFGFVPMLQIADFLLNDRLPEAREAARNIMKALQEAFHGVYYHPDPESSEKWKKFLLLNMSKSSYCLLEV